MMNPTVKESQDRRKWRWRYDIEDCGGWQYLLGNNFDAHILCVTTDYSLAPFLLSNMYKSVTHICMDSGSMEKYMMVKEELGYDNLEIKGCRDNWEIGNFADKSFDGVVIHSPDQLHVHDILFRNLKRSEALENMIGEIFRILKDSGFFYYSHANRFGYNRIRNNVTLLMAESLKIVPGVGLALSRKKLLAVLGKIGFMNIQEYPMLYEQGRLVEVIPEIGYQSLKNIGTRGEKLRELLMNKWMAKYTAPAHAIMAYKLSEAGNQMDNLRYEIVAKYLKAGKEKSVLQVLKFMVLSAGKVVLLFGYDKKKAVVAVFISNNKLAKERRDKEIVLLDKLRNIKESLPFDIPEQIGRFEWNERSCYVQKALPGVTMDVVWPEMDKVTEEAAENLIEFNRITSRSAQEGVFDSMDTLDRMYQSAVSRMPEIEDGLYRLYQRILKDINTENLITVFLHGDYNIENIMVNEESFKVESVIDWELSEERGFPWIDMIYLILYNRTIKDQRKFLDVFLSYLLDGFTENRERMLRDKYFSSLSININSEPLLTRVFFLHHLAYREEYDLDNKTVSRSITKILDLLAKPIGG